MEGEKICTFVSMFALSLFLNWRNCLFPSSCEDEYGYESNNGIREALHPELKQDSKDEMSISMVQEFCCKIQTKEIRKVKFLFNS